jgi:DNA-binding NarL/FixJ family response regulator
MEAGADAFVLKHSIATDLLNAVDAVRNAIESAPTVNPRFSDETRDL